MALVYFGNAGEAVRLIDRAIALDPLNPRPYAFKSFALTFVRRYLDAIDAGRKALTLAPQRHNTRIWIGDAFLLLGQPDKAKVEYEGVSTDSPFRLARLALLAAHIRNRGEAERITTQLKRQQGDTDSYQYAQIYAQLGDNDRAFAEFDNAIRAIDSGLSYLKVDPFLDPIRNDLRYAALLRKLNFP